MKPQAQASGRQTVDAFRLIQSVDADKLKIAIVLAPLAMLLMVVAAMMQPQGVPGLGGPQNFNYRIPPAWSPENESQYSFRAYILT